MEEHKFPDKLLDGVIIDARRKKKIEVSFQTEDGEKVEFSKVTESVLSYMNAQLSKPNAEESQIITQIYPFVSCGLVHSLPTAFRSTAIASMFLSLPSIREALTYEGTFFFYLIKFIRKNKLKISTTEYDISDEDIKIYVQKAHTSQLIMLAGSLGMNKDQFLQAVIETDTLSDDMLAEAGYTKEEIAKHKRGVHSEDPFSSQIPKDKKSQAN